MQPIPKLWRLGTEQKCKHTKKVKMKLKRTLQLAVLFVTISLGSMAFGQTSDWKLIHSENGVNIFALESECSIKADWKPANYAFLKIENTTNSDKTLSYNFGLQYEEECSGCDGMYEWYFTLDVPANTTLEGDCTHEKGLTRIISNPNLPGGYTFESIKIANTEID